MPGPLPASTRSKIIRLLLLQWRPDAIAEEVYCHTATVYNMQESLFIYGSAYRPQFRPKGCPRKVSKAAEDSLIHYLNEQPWALQKELVWFLWEEWDINVNQATVSRLLKRRRWSSQSACRLGDGQNNELRIQWAAECLHLRAEQLVFVDETLFNESTGWRHRAYAPIGQPARYHSSLRRGHSWGVLPAYTVDGYLPCIAIREGYYNAETFRQWVEDDLLPLCNAWPAPRSVIILDNASAHCNPRVEEVIRQAACEVRYLPPYSPDLNPIELSFSVLKAWVRQHFHLIWPTFQGSFGEFLRYAVIRSRCDRFAVEHFRHSNGGYIFQADIQDYEARLSRNEIEIDFDINN